MSWPLDSFTSKIEVGLQLGHHWYKYGTEYILLFPSERRNQSCKEKNQTSGPCCTAEATSTNTQMIPKTNNDHVSLPESKIASTSSISTESLACLPNSKVLRPPKVSGCDHPCSSSIRLNGWSGSRGSHRGSASAGLPKVLEVHGDSAWIDQPGRL